MSYHPKVQSCHTGEPSREEVLRDRWHEIADTAGDSRELCFFALMLLEELGIARGLLLAPNPASRSDSSFEGTFRLNSSRFGQQTWEELEEQWLVRLREADTLPQLREAFEDLLDEYLAARASSQDL